MTSKSKGLIAPSLLSADFGRLADELKSVEDGGADWHHFDVMDGHFVPNLSFGIPVVKAVKKISKIPVDVHLMISNPDEMALAYADAGADSVSFHVEAAIHHHRLIQALKTKGVKAGIAINPGTSLDALSSLNSCVDFVLVMSVNPGFGGQKFIHDSLGRIEALRATLDGLGRQSVMIEVDGGINSENAPMVRDSGADILVAGSYVYGAKDRGQKISSLRGKN